MLLTPLSSIRPTLCQHRIFPGPASKQDPLLSSPGASASTIPASPSSPPVLISGDRTTRQAVEDGQNNFGSTGSPGGGGGGGGSAGDVEHDPAVRRARVLTASLKSVGGRAQAWIASLKAAGAGASATAQVALEASKDEFGEVILPASVAEIFNAKGR